jgi:hypothetical protein
MQLSAKPTGFAKVVSMSKGGRAPYKKGYRHENNERKFWLPWFGRFGDGCRRSFLSRGADITFFDHLFRRWKVSCKVKKLPKWIWDELENHDVVSVKQDGKLVVRFMVDTKLEELLLAAGGVKEEISE